MYSLCRKVTGISFHLHANNHFPATCEQDVEINRHVFDAFHVQHILPSAGIDSTTSSYVPAPQETNAVDSSGGDNPIVVE
jgi:hypothetical protein